VLAILSITAPIFAIVALGYVTTRGGLFRPSDMRVLGNFVLHIALPALLFNAIASRPLTEVLNTTYMGIYLVACLATLGVAWIWFAMTGVGPARRVIGAMGSSCPNSGFIGYPLMLLVLPDYAGQVLALNFLVENFVLIPLLLILLEMTRPRSDHGVWPLLRGMFASLIKRPLIIALLLGLGVAALQIPIPTTMTRLLQMLAGAASAPALFVIGGSLVGLPSRGNIGLAAQIVVGKLLLHPAIAAFALFIVIPLIGVTALAPELQAALILSAALPMFGVYTLFAQDYGHEGVASLALLGATTAAFVTLSVVLSFLGGWGLLG